MERQIKFRAWDGEEMHNVIYYKGGKRCVVPLRRFPGQEEIIVESIMQFTGLLDKNGVEIYEGDILNIDKAGIYNEGTAVIEWRDWLSNENWMLSKAGWFLNTKCKQIWTEKTIEVIGNIHTK